MTINKQTNRLQKPEIQQDEGEEEREYLSAPPSSVGWVGRGVILMQSADEWEVAGASFVDKLFCPGMEPGSRI